MKFLVSLVFFCSFFQAFAFNPEKYFTSRCTVCHEISDVGKIGPGLQGVTERRSEDWIIRFIQNSQEVIQSGDEQAVALFEKWDKRVMPPHDITDEQARALIKYIASGGTENEIIEDVKVDTSSADGDSSSGGSAKEILTAKEKLSSSSAATTILAVLGMLAALAIVGAVFLYAGPLLKAGFFGVIALAVVGAGAYELVKFAKNTDYTIGYAPEQPIKFSHKIHAGDNEIACLYCHYGADKGRHGTIPPVSLCMNCHSYVKTESEEIQKIYDAIDEERSIEWEKVHHLPDFAAFNHSVHINSGKVSCQDCHGPVEEMDIVQQVHNLSMGFCLNCHKGHDEAFTEERPDNAVPGSMFNCASCHY